jgi:cytochrome c biogenesis protein CcdA
MAVKVIGAGLCFLLNVLLVAFLASAQWGALGRHPGRIVTGAIMVLIAVALLICGIRLLRSDRRTS